MTYLIKRLFAVIPVLAVVAVIVFLLLRYSASEKQKAHRRLQQEQQRAERLLLNILPGPVAERLKHSDQTIATRVGPIPLYVVVIATIIGLLVVVDPRTRFNESIFRFGRKPPGGRPGLRRRGDRWTRTR